MGIPEHVRLARRRNQLLTVAKQYTVGSYSRTFVAPLFQRMIRGIFGADSRPYVTAVVAGSLRQVKRSPGQCVCVTCGTVAGWDSGIRGMHTGHFLASRCNSILYEEDNVAPQCSHCNYYLSGAPQAFRQWMDFVRGSETIDRLTKLKATVRTFTRDELVDMRIDFGKRLSEALQRLTAA